MKYICPSSAPAFLDHDLTESELDHTMQLASQHITGDYMFNNRPYFFTYAEYIE